MKRAVFRPLFLAPRKEFESPTFRLGGGRSILLSYRGMRCIIVAEICLPVNKNGGIFSQPRHILSGKPFGKEAFP